MTAEMDSPTGLDMHPRPPAAVRVRRGVGIAAIIVFAVLALAIVYGVYERQRRQTQASFISDVERKATPATSASSEFTSKISASDVPALEPNVHLPEVKATLGSDDNRTIAPQTDARASRMRATTASAPALSYQNGVERADDSARGLAYQRELEAIDAPTPIGGGAEPTGAMRALPTRAVFRR